MPSDRQTGAAEFQKWQSFFEVSFSQVENKRRCWGGVCVWVVAPPVRTGHAPGGWSRPHMLVLILVWLLAGVSSPWLPSLGGD